MFNFEVHLSSTLLEMKLEVELIAYVDIYIYICVYLNVRILLEHHSM